MKKTKTSSALFDEAELALKEAYTDLVTESQRMGFPIVVVRDGTVVRMKPEIVLRESRAMYSTRRKDGE